MFKKIFPIKADANYYSQKFDFYKPYMRMLIIEIMLIIFYLTFIEKNGIFGVNIFLIILSMAILLLWKWLSRKQFELFSLIGCLVCHCYFLWIRTHMGLSKPGIAFFLRGINMGLAEAVAIFTQANLLYSSIACLAILGVKLYLIGFEDISAVSFSVFISLVVLLVRVAIESANRKMYNDLKEKNDSLEKFKTLIEMHVPSGMVVIEKETQHIVFSNNHFKKMFECEGECPLSVLQTIKISEDSRKLVLSSTEDSLKSNIISDLNLLSINLVKNMEKFPSKLSCYMKINEQKRYFEANFFSFSWERKDSVIIFLTEVTQQVENAELIALNSHKELAISTVAHEIRNPLTGILGIAQLVSAMNKNAKIKERLNTMVTVASYLVNLLNSILDLQQFKNKRLTLNYSMFPLREVTDVLLNIFEFQAREKRIHFKLEFEVDPDIKIFSDKDRLAQILINLCANAIKFTFQGGVTLKIRPADRYNLDFIVSDTGVGMKPEEMNKLFSAFGKLESTTSINKQGVGLGLLISNSLVKTFNLNKPDNQIKVQSTEGFGSTFSFSLDVGDYQDCLEVSSDVVLDIFKDSVESVGISQYSPSLQSRSFLARGKQEKDMVIIADDNPFNLIAFKQLIEDYRYKVLTAMSGKEAVEMAMLHSKKVKVIFMDFEMPIMNGIEATELLAGKMKQGTLPKMKIVGISGNDDEKIIKEWYEKGLDACLIKPITKSRVGELLGKQE